LQSTILDDIKHKLTDRKALLELTRAYHERWAERQQTIRVDRDNAERQLNRVMVQIDRIVTAISDSDEPVKGLVEKLKTLETERASLAEKVRLIEADGNVVTLHPAAIDKFSEAMDGMHAALTGDLDIQQLAPFRAAFRNTFERLVVHPTGRRRQYDAICSAIGDHGLGTFPQNAQHHGNPCRTRGFS
jgi:site-specific DNA recombinase